MFFDKFSFLCLAHLSCWMTPRNLEAKSMNTPCDVSLLAPSVMCLCCSQSRWFHLVTCSLNDCNLYFLGSFSPAWNSWQSFKLQVVYSLLRCLVHPWYQVRRCFLKRLSPFSSSAHPFQTLQLFWLMLLLQWFPAPYIPFTFFFFFLLNNNLSHQTSYRRLHDIVWQTV